MFRLKSLWNRLFPYYDLSLRISLLQNAGYFPWQVARTCISLSPSLLYLLLPPPPFPTLHTPRLPPAMGSDQGPNHPLPIDWQKRAKKYRFCRPEYIKCSWSCFSPVGHVAWCFVAPCPQSSSTQGRFPCHNSRLGAGFPKQHLGTLTRQNQQHAQRNSSVPDSQLQFHRFLQEGNTQRGGWFLMARPMKSSSSQVFASDFPGNPSLTTVPHSKFPVSPLQMTKSNENSA